MGKAKKFLKSRIESLKDSDYTAEFSEHEYPPIDLERGREIGKQAEAVDPKYRALKEKMLAAAKKVGRTVAMLLM